jgi:hypothetical protein
MSFGCSRREVLVENTAGRRWHAYPWPSGSSAQPSCPHAVYLHSALAKDRIQAAGRQERQTLLIYSKWDCNTGLGIAGLVNPSMLCIAAALFHKPGMTDMSDLGPIHAHLGTLVGGGAALAFGIALMASGLSSSSVGTYAGQIVMAGFMNWLHRVQIAGHYCTNRAAKPHRAPARQKIWPETPEQHVLTVSADLGRCPGRSRVRVGCPATTAATASVNCAHMPAEPAGSLCAIIETAHTGRPGPRRRTYQ